ncbi:MAG TPA: alpha/beta hydrolase [Casimicrobiaceae bacterium]|nr:alpha/beta hydrolase [Casimicrobiaceae bacterium]
MQAAAQAFVLNDGRTVDVFLGGDSGGFALVMHHGTPSDATTFSDWDGACRDRALRLVCASRPGYAASTRNPGRDVASAARDSAEILDRLGHRAFATAGWSGGGPHALACAALLPDRCRAVATLAGVGPNAQPDLDFTAGMGPENVEEFGAAMAGETALRTWMERNGEPMREVTGATLVEAFGGLVPPVDKDVLVGGFADHMAAVMRRALEQGLDGWIDDDLAFARPWGFDVAAVRAAVTVWQGDLDLMVPFAHGRWLARRLPNARAHMAPGHGHLSLVTRYRGEILDDLVARSGPR